MYNQHRYGTILRGTHRLPLQRDTTIEHIAFGDYDFSDIIITNVPNSFGGNKFDVQHYKTATHGEGFNSWKIAGKTFTVNGWLQAENQGVLESLIDKIKSQLLKGQQTLSIKRAYGLIHTQAVVSALSIPREQRTVNVVPISITFDVFDPFRYGQDATELAFFGVASIFNETISYHSGSYFAKPIIYLTFNAASEVDTIQYTLNNKTVTVYTPITAGDVLCIHGEKLNVAKNGEYGANRQGEFGELPLGNYPITISINGTYNTEIFITYRNCYV